MTSSRIVPCHAIVYSRRMKRVALYYPWIYVRSGVERTILELVRRSRHQYTVFTNHYDAGQTYPQFRAFERLVVLRKVPVERSFGTVLRAASIIVRQKLPLDSFDALLISSEGLGDLVTFRNSSKPVFCFCHTPVRPVYDPVYRRVWLQRHPRSRLMLGMFSKLYHAVTRAAWRRYRRVFVNSAEVRGRVLTGGLCQPDRIEVLHPGVDAFVLERQLLFPVPGKGHFFLLVFGVCRNRIFPKVVHLELLLLVSLPFA